MADVVDHDEEAICCRCIDEPTAVLSLKPTWLKHR